MDASGSALSLPRPLQDRLEAATRAFMQPAGRPAIDFASPAGEPALVPPDSVCWQVFKNPVTLLIGGIAAVILELAEPRVRTGVWHHTSFRDRPAARLQRTGVAALATVYGPRSATEAMIAGVTRLHAGVHGVTPGGAPYRANDPELLEWVHATASFGFVQAYGAFVRPLDTHERDRFYAEGAPIARLYGARAAPCTQAEVRGLFERMAPLLEPSPIVDEFLGIMCTAELLSAWTRPMQGWLVRAAVEITPAWLRQRLGLDDAWRLAPWQRRLVKRAARTADRLLLRSGPAAQACRRLGLPEDYLYARG
jgi:uncharacterized protein (DUF2236 family)